MRVALGLTVLLFCCNRMPPAVVQWDLKASQPQASPKSPVVPQREAGTPPRVAPRSWGSANISGRGVGGELSERERPGAARRAGRVSAEAVPRARAEGGAGAEARSTRRARPPGGLSVYSSSLVRCVCVGLGVRESACVCPPSS